MNEFVENIKTEIKKYLEESPFVVSSLLSHPEDNEYVHLAFPEFGYFTFAFLRFNGSIITKVFSGDMLKKLGSMSKEEIMSEKGYATFKTKITADLEEI